MNERTFMSNVKLSFLDHNLWATTLVDGSDFQTRPCDMIACLEGKLVAIEGKFQKSFSAFGIKHIRDSQVLNLDAISQGRGVAFIFLNIWIPNKENRLLIWEWEIFKKITANASLKKKTLLEMPYIQGAKKRFPIEDILLEIDSQLKRKSEFIG